jgi:hypothetical protein
MGIVLTDKNLELKTARTVPKPGVDAKPKEITTEPEIIALRTQHGKTWDLGNSKRRLITKLAPLHYKNDRTDEKETWKDVDLTIQADLTLNTVPYDLTISQTGVAYTYVSKQGGRIEVELTHVGGIAVDLQNVVKSRDVNEYYWENVATDFDIKLTARGDGVDVFQFLKSNTAPRTTKWTVRQWKNSKCVFQNRAYGSDSNIGRLELTSTLTQKIGTLDYDNYEFETEWTGRATEINDLQTRIKAWTTVPIYPVVIQDAIEEGEILNNADDVQEYNNTTLSINGNTISVDDNHRAGLRFDSIGVPGNATITTAQLKLYNLKCYANSGKVYFSNADDPGAFTANDRPSQMGALIPAGGHTFDAWVNSGHNAWRTDGVTSAVQTIVNRTGWNSNQAMRLRIDDADIPFYVWLYARDQGTSKSAELDITYTAGGGPADVFRDRSILRGVGKGIFSFMPAMPLIALLKNKIMTKRELFNPLNWVK